MTTPNELTPVVTVTDKAKNIARLLGKLDKADAKAAEHDTVAAKANAEIMGMAQGEIKQTPDRNMMDVVKEKSAAEKKAASVREKTKEEAEELQGIIGDFNADVTRILSGFGLTAGEAEAVEAVEAAEDTADEEEVA